jgi:hypothetical protein
MDKQTMNSVLEGLKGVVQDKMSEINNEIKNKITNIETNVVNQGLANIKQRFQNMEIVGTLLYILPIILLLYIIYLLNKYH